MAQKGVVSILPFRLSILHCKKDKLPLLAHTLLKIFLFPPEEARFFSITESADEVSFIVDSNTLTLFPPARLVPTSLPHADSSTPVPRTPRGPSRSSFSKETNPLLSSSPSANSINNHHLTISSPSSSTSSGLLANHRTIPTTTDNNSERQSNTSVITSRSVQELDSDANDVHKNIAQLSGLEVCDIYWRAFQISEGLTDSTTKLVTAMSAPLAAAGISIFNLSTYETDYVLVPESKIYDALDALTKEFSILTEGLDDLEKEVPRECLANSSSIPTIVDNQQKFKLALPSHNLLLVGVRKEMISTVGQNMLRMLLFPQAQSRFVSYTETEDEVSIMLDAQSLTDLPCDILLNTNEEWTLIRVGETPLGFTMTGIVNSIAETLSKAGVELFYVSTFETDYVLVHEHEAEKAVEALRNNPEKFII